MRKKIFIMGLVVLLIVLMAGCGSTEVDKDTSGATTQKDNKVTQSAEKETGKDVSFPVSEEEVYWKDEFLHPDSECTLLTTAVNEIGNDTFCTIVKDGAVLTVPKTANGRAAEDIGNLDYSALPKEVTIYDTAYAKVTIIDFKTSEDYEGNQCVEEAIVKIENKLPTEAVVEFKDIYINGCLVTYLESSACMDALSTKRWSIPLGESSDYYLNFWGIEKAFNLSGTISVQVKKPEAEDLYVPANRDTLEYSEVSFVCGDAHIKQRREFGGATVSVDGITVEMCSPTFEVGYYTKLGISFLVYNNTGERIKVSHADITVDGKETEEDVSEVVAPGGAALQSIFVLDCIPEEGVTEAFVTFTFELEDGTTVTTDAIRVINE